MTYLAYVIAALMMLATNTSKMTGYEGLHAYLRDVVSIQGVFFWASIGIWVLAMAIVLIGGRKLNLKGCGGCLTVLLVLLPAITDPDGNEDWLCAGDVQRPGENLAWS